jgi:hypothetical protein
LKVLLPDKATASAAHRLLCDLPGCWPAVLDVVNYAKTLPHPINLPHPNCLVNSSQGTVTQQEGQEHVASTEMIIIVVAMLLAMVGGISLLHWVVTPWWLRKSAQAATPMARRLKAASSFSAALAEVQAREASFRLQLDALAIVDAEQPAPNVGTLFAADLRRLAQQSSTHAVPPEGSPSPSPPAPEGSPSSLECVVAIHDEASVMHPSPSPIGALASPKSPLAAVATEALPRLDDVHPGLEVLAHAKLFEARSRCRAHIVLMCAVGICATLVRVVLSAAGAVGPSMVFIIALCVFQLGSLARTSLMPIILPEAGSKDAGALSSLQKWTHACSYLLGDLRIYAGTTLICEFIVLIVVASEAFSSDDDSQVDDHSGLAAEHFGDDGLISAPVRKLVLSQAALTLVLLRFYTAWLAHSLHKLRIDLTNVVLPDTPKAPACDEKQSASEQKSRLNALMPAWDLPSDALPEMTRREACRAWLRSASLYWAALAMLLLIAAAIIGVWSAKQAPKQASTCRTAAAGLDFCVQKSYLGIFTTVGSYAECCQACDSTQGCQAWSFQETTGQCWQMRFDAEPCKRWPGHEACRCHTSVDRIAGYRPGAEDVAMS